MLLKLGVDISRLLPPIRKKLCLIDRLFSEFGDGEAVITSTFEGNHISGSLHYANLAIDFRAPKDILPISNALMSNLGSDYDIIVSKSCIHIEYDPS